MTTLAPTEKQLSYALALAVRAGLPATPTTLSAMTRAQVSQFITDMRNVPAAPRAQAPVEITEGVYRHADTYARVKRAVHGSGNLYATVLRAGSWEYAPGLVRRLTMADRLTLEEAKAYGHLYGQCIVCGRTLTDEKSIEAGIGPICAGRL